MNNNLVIATLVAFLAVAGEKYFGVMFDGATFQTLILDVVVKASATVAAVMALRAAWLKFWKSRKSG